MLVVGLTGGIASGKSTISKILLDLGAKVIDADKIARGVVEPGTSTWREIKEHFGPNIIKADQGIDRSRLGEIIFNNPEKRIVLNNIIHPEVIRQTRQLIDLYQNNPTVPLIVVDAPLLIEAKMTSLVDEVWVINISTAKQIERVMVRDNLSKPEAEKIIYSQMPTSEKLQYADRIIDTGGSIQETKNQVKKIWDEIMIKA